MAYFNRRDFESIQLKEGRKVTASVVFDSAAGKQQEYDVFISHSIKDKELVKKIRQLLEEKYNLSAYIDWDEDSGTKRDDISEKVKAAMNISKSFMFVKTSNSDDSQWTAWETGYYDNVNSDKIGVLLIEDEKITKDTWEHREFLKDYYILEKDDIVSFVSNGVRKTIEAKEKALHLNTALENKAVSLNTSKGKLEVGAAMTGTATKFYGTSKKINA